LGHEWDAAAYDRVSDPHVRWAGPVIERISPHGVHHLIDAGCGSGRVTQMLLERFPDVHVTAVDASEAMLIEAGRRLEHFGDRIDFVQANLSEPLPALPTADVVFSTAAFHWITDHVALFRNLAGVMRSGGQLVAQWGGGDNVARVVAALREVGDGWPGPWYFATVEETRAHLSDAGFIDLEVWTHDDPADFASQEALEEFMRTALLVAHLERIEDGQRDEFVRAVADRLPDRRIDYVRINAVARLS
jgi:trans-aconitate 2-methyltransferase